MKKEAKQGVEIEVPTDSKERKVTVVEVETKTPVYRLSLGEQRGLITRHTTVGSTAASNSTGTRVLKCRRRIYVRTAIFFNKWHFFYYYFAPCLPILCTLLVIFLLPFFAQIWYT